MSWIGKQVKRTDDGEKGVIIKEDKGRLTKLTIQMEQGDISTTYLYPWATLRPNEFMFLTFDKDCWINLNGHEHGVESV